MCKVKEEKNEGTIPNRTSIGPIIIQKIQIGFNSDISFHCIYNRNPEVTYVKETK